MSSPPKEASDDGAAQGGKSPSQAGTVELKVKTLDSKTFTYHVKPSTTVAELKAMVAADTGIRADLQRIIFRGKVLKDKSCLSEHKGVLDGGSVVHCVGRPDAAEGSSSAASGPGAHPSNAAGTQGEAGPGGPRVARRNAPGPGFVAGGNGPNTFRLTGNQGGTVMMGSIALGNDDGAADGQLLNQFLSQALGGLVGGAGPGVPEAGPEEVVENDGRRFSDMTAFADFVESYVGTVQSQAANYRMRAEEQQIQMQRLVYASETPQQDGQAEAPADRDQRAEQVEQSTQAGSTDTAELSAPSSDVLGAAAGAESAHDAGSSGTPAAASASYPPPTTSGNGGERPRGRAFPANSPLAALASLSELLRWPGSSDAGESERVGGGFGSAAQPVQPAGTNAAPNAANAAPAASRPAPEGNLSPHHDPESGAPTVPPPTTTSADAPAAAASFGAAGVQADASVTAPAVFAPSHAPQPTTHHAAPSPPANPAHSHEVHELVTCDGCGQSPIQGPRWKCTRCPDFDLCDVCHGHFSATGRYHIQGHTFNRIAPVPRRRGAPPHRPPVINGTPRRVGASAASASAALAPDLQQLLLSAVRNYDALRPHMEELRSAVSREGELRGTERDRAEGLAVAMAPAVRDLGAVMLDIAPILSNLRMGDEPGHAVVQTGSSMIHMPTGYRTLEASRREQYLQRAQAEHTRQQHTRQQRQRQQQRQAAARQAGHLRRQGERGQRNASASGQQWLAAAASRAGGGAGTTAPAAGTAPRAAATSSQTASERPIGEIFERVPRQNSGEASGVREPPRRPSSESTLFQLSQLRNVLEGEMVGHNSRRSQEQVGNDMSSDQEAVHGPELIDSMGQGASTRAAPAASMGADSHDASAPRSTSAGGGGMPNRNSTTSASATSSRSSTFAGPFMAAEGTSAPPFPFSFVSGAPFPPGMQAMGAAPASTSPAAGFVFGTSAGAPPVAFPWQQIFSAASHSSATHPGTTQQPPAAVPSGLASASAPPLPPRGLFSSGSAQAQNGATGGLPAGQAPAGAGTGAGGDARAQGSFAPRPSTFQSLPVGSGGFAGLGGSVHVQMAVNGVPLPIPGMQGMQGQTAAASTASGAPSSMPSNAPGVPQSGASASGDVLGAATVFQQLMQMRQMQQQQPSGDDTTSSQGQPQPPSSAAGVPPDAFNEQIRQQVAAAASAAAASFPPGMQEAFQAQLTQQIESQIRSQMSGLQQGMPGHLNGPPPTGQPLQPPVWLPPVSIATGDGNTEVQHQVGVLVGLGPGMDLSALSDMLLPGADSNLGMAHGGDGSVGFIEGLLHFVADRTPEGYDASALVRGELAPMQGLQGAMANYLIEDLLGDGYTDHDLQESAMDMASSLIDGITVDHIIGGERSSALAVAIPPTQIDDLIWRRLVEHSRSFLDLVMGDHVNTTTSNPHPFAMGLRNWLAQTLADLLHRLSACFSGRSDAARQFLREFITTRLSTQETGQPQAATVDEILALIGSDSQHLGAEA